MRKPQKRNVIKMEGFTSISAMQTTRLANAANEVGDSNANGECGEERMQSENLFIMDGECAGLCGPWTRYSNEKCKS